MKKNSVDRIISNAIILTVNPRNEVIRNGSLAIKDRKIVSLGSNKDIESAYEAVEILDATDQIAMPGLVDTHFHTGQQFERNLMTYLKKRPVCAIPSGSTRSFPLKRPYPMRIST